MKYVSSKISDDIFNSLSGLRICNRKIVNSKKSRIKGRNKTVVIHLQSNFDKLDFFT